MKKLLIALLALGALSFAPVVEAGRNRACEKPCKKEKACKKECKKRTFKQSCAPRCSEKTVVDHVKWIPCKVDGKMPVTCYKTIRTCVDESECCDYQSGEPVCLQPGETLNDEETTVSEDVE